MTEFDSQVRLAVYVHFAETGRALTVGEVASRLNATGSAVEESFRRLEALHAWALAPGSVNIWMAHPFSAVPTQHAVRVGLKTYWANCAWDALSIPSVLNQSAEIATVCADSGDALHMVISNGALEHTSEVVHFAIPPRRFWENVAFT